MRNNVRKRLPKFKPDEVALVKGSCDFLGINYYTARYAQNVPRETFITHYQNDLHVVDHTHRNGKPIGKWGGSDWLYIVPEGIYNMMLYITERYNNLEIFVIENGVDELKNNNQPISEACIDETRVEYFKDHLAYLKKAMDCGVHLKATSKNAPPILSTTVDALTAANGHTYGTGSNFQAPRDRASPHSNFQARGSSSTRPHSYLSSLDLPALSTQYPGVEFLMIDNVNGLHRSSSASSNPYFLKNSLTSSNFALFNITNNPFSSSSDGSTFAYNSLLEACLFGLEFGGTFSPIDPGKIVPLWKNWWEK
ncbi:unnamed protein product [Fraxinus pennsylvanica]|uniref:Beta-glucosidase n=1 Tax=Fraxinus pennsylvanica TaxID=56036 RepID=A0AAD2DLH8_9LAMI|nr:unnamed protein product [Fraxinus pennsylvanica]